MTKNALAVVDRLVSGRLVITVGKATIRAENVVAVLAAVFIVALVL